MFALALPSSRLTPLAGPSCIRSVLSRRGVGHLPELTTLSSTSPSALFLRLKDRLGKGPSRPVIAYALPTSLPPSTIPFFLDLIRSSASSSVGLLSSPLPSRASPSSAPLHSIAIAVLDPAIARVFRSLKKGRDKVSVGRWRPFGEADPSLVDDHQQVARAADGGDWSSVWNPTVEASAGEAGAQLQTDSPLQGLGEVDRDAIMCALVFAAPTAASPSLQALAEAFPSSSKLGLITPPTPFVTVRPFTLFLNDSTLDDGAVGVALLRSPSGSSTAGDLSVTWSELEPLDSTVCEVRESQGNLLLRMHASPSLSPPSSSPQKGSSSSPNPTQHLISLLASSTLSSLTNAAVGASWLGGKETNFYLGFLEPESTSTVRRVIRILSGDPKRGGMALDTEESVHVGDRFLFLHRPTPAPAPAASATGSRSTAFEFSTVPEAVGLYPSDKSEDAEVHVEEGVFRAGSESGFIVGQPGAVAWADGGVPSGKVALAFDSDSS